LKKNDVLYQTTYTDLNRNDFCCAEIYDALLGEGDGNCELCFGYDSVLREYFIDVRPEYGGTCQLIRYCPWCGKKFPKGLQDEWFDILKKEYNIEPEFLKWRKRKDVLSEFKSDEWWKKEGFKIDNFIESKD
jgi:hypothetical protein